MGRDVVSREEWLAARTRLLEQEKAHSRQRDALTRARQALPWVALDEDYVFEGPAGPVRLSELFDGKSQLLVQHFMFAPDWDEGCKSCSFMADHMQPALVHIAQRDVSFAAVSRAPLEKLLAFRERMGWTFPWVSCAASDFNRDFQVSFTQAELEAGRATYNYLDGHRVQVSDMPGLSVFARDPDGRMFHTYSRYGRGCEDVMTAYDLLDYVPKGRDERHNMDWLRLKDRY